MLTWDPKVRVGEIIWGLIFPFPEKIFFSSKILGGQLILWVL